MGDGGRVALETQLREQEETIRRLNQKVQDTQRQLTAQDQEIVALRSGRSKNSASFASHTEDANPTPEVDVAWGSVTAVSIHKLTSAITGVSTGRPVASIVIQPVDRQNEIVKVAGELSVRVSMVDTNNSGADTTLATKAYTITDSRRLWSRGLISSGFHVELPLSTAHGDLRGQEVLVTAQLSLGTDRQYSDSMLLTVE